MKKFYKFICVLLILSLIFCSTVFADEAADMVSDEDDVVSYSFTISEYDLYKELTSLSEEELAASGYDAEAIEELQTVTFEEALLERSELSEDELAAYGYSDDQITVLKSYDGSLITEDSLITAAISDLTGTLSGSVGSSTATVQYKWEWSSRPLFEYTDMAALTWKASNSSGTEISTETVVAACAVVYRNTTTGVLLKSVSVTPTYSDVDNYAYAKFDMDISVNDVYGWAKSGTLGITVEPQGSDAIYSISAAGGYGHSILTVDISVTIEYENLSITFTPSSSVTYAITSSKTYYK